MEQMEQVLPPDFSGTFYSAENALKFTYSKVEFQKISGGNTPGPPLYRSREGKLYLINYLLPPEWKPGYATGCMDGQENVRHMQGRRGRNSCC